SSPLGGEGSGVRGMAIKTPHPCPSPPRGEGKEVIHIHGRLLSSKRELLWHRRRAVAISRPRFGGPGRRVPYFNRSEREEMKKLFWSSVAVAVAAASCVYLASRHVERVPFSVVGQAVDASLGGEETSASGTGGALPGVPEPSAVDAQAAELAPMDVV